MARLSDPITILKGIGPSKAKLFENLNIFTLQDLMEADEIIVSSSGSLCLAAEIIDGKAVGGKAPELLKALQDEVLREFNEETKA